MSRLQRLLTVSVVLLIAQAALAQSGFLETYVIPSGPNAGRKLIDVVQRYRVNGIKIPVRAIEDSFSFFDQYRGTRRSYRYYHMLPDPKYPGAMDFGSDVETASGPTIGNPRYIVILDLDKSSSLPREHKIDLMTGKIESTWAAHGIGSGRGDRATKFVSNTDDTTASPLGFFVTGGVVQTWRGPSIRLYGAEKETPGGFSGNDVPNSLMIHPAPYVFKGHAGHSHGCPAMNAGVLARWKDQIEGGALFYFYSSQLDSQNRKDDLSGLISPTEGDRDPRVTQTKDKPLGPGFAVPATDEAPTDAGNPKD